MSSQQGKWREEQILILCPGSRVTMAQLGCNELTPPALRLPTRMFPAEEDGPNQWRAHSTTKRQKILPPGVTPSSPEDEWEFVENPDSAQGAVYPMQGGRIVHMDAFLAFLEHVHGLLTTTHHNTPIVLMASPQWTRPDCEIIVRYIFERTKTPALCLIHSGIATQYGLKWGSMTVVDIGFEKVDVTCIYDSRIVSQKEVNVVEGTDCAISGGEVFTMKLLELLEKRGLTYPLAEQLKKSSICEVLPYVADSPDLMDLPRDGPASAGAGSDGPHAAETQRSVNPAAADADDVLIGGKATEDEGVLDVANIVASGNTREFLAKKEKEKAEKAKAGKRGRDKDADMAKAARLPNAKRSKNIFQWEEEVDEKVLPKAPKPDAQVSAPAAAPAPGTGTTDVSMTDGAVNGTDAAETKPTVEQSTEAPKLEESVTENQESDAAAGQTNGTSEAPTEQIPKSEEPAAQLPADSAQPPAEPVPAAEPVAQPEVIERITRVKKDMEIGLERFTFAQRHEIDRIVTAIYRAIQGIDEVYMRPLCWDNLVFVGNGARLRGLRENIIQTLQARYLISPSTATMFTSELPSNMGTPTGTGSQTPTGSFTSMPHQLPTSSNVNPLLQAATTANLPLPGAPGAPGSNMGDAMPIHHSHGQTPTSIRLAPLPTYLTEWVKNGFEEAMFLGAQVAGRLAFTVHNLDQQGLESQKYMSLNRMEYNELGPKGIRDHSMLG